MPTKVDVKLPQTQKVPVKDIDLSERLKFTNWVTFFNKLQPARVVNFEIYNADLTVLKLYFHRNIKR